MSERLYKTSEVAALWSIHEETVLRLARRGKLRSVRFGNERRYPESALEEYKLAHTDGGVTVPARVRTLASHRQGRPV